MDVEVTVPSHEHIGSISQPLGRSPVSPHPTPGETWVPREGEGGRYEHCLHLEGRDEGSGAWGVATGSI